MNEKLNVVDVTEVDTEQFLREVREQVAGVLEAGHPFAMVALQETSDQSVTLRNVIACGEEHLLPLTVGFMQVLGTARLGVDAMSNLPPEFQQSMALAAGLKAVNGYLQDMAGRAQAMRSPRTPAGDATSH
jgi:hypothetical protein